MKKFTLICSALFFFILLSGCSQNEFSNLSAFDESSSVNLEDIQTGITKEQTMENIKNDRNQEIDTIIANNFSYIDNVSGKETVANVYGTDLFGVEELADLLNETKQPDEISEYIDGQQILIYQDLFIILKDSEELENVTIIEVASNQFVRNNYNPSFLQTYFAIRLLDDVLDVDDWGKNRRKYCQTNDCYGGYSSSTGKAYSGGSTTNRGMSSVRGGGPSSGK
jgi:hypothetical protein